MWRSEKARTRAILVMLAPHHALAGLWTYDGPTDLALTYLERDGGPLSSGEAVLLRAAFDLWNGTGRCTVDALLSTLDARTLRAVAMALLARDGGAEASRG